MQKVFSAIFIIGFIFTPAFLRGDFSIIEKGKGATVLVLPAEKNEELKKVTDWFVGELEKCSSVKLPVTTNYTGSGNRIIFRVVKRDFIRRSLYTVDFPDKFSMQITGSTLGIRYALNHLLEKAGIVYVFPGKEGAYYPKVTKLSLPRVKQEKDAAFTIYRSQHITDEAWQLALNCELRDSRMLLNHGIDRIFPLSKYGKGEWVNKILPVRYGKRDLKVKRYQWEPCYSNPATAEEAIKNISAYFEKYPDTPTFSLVINDGYNYYCQCKECEVANAGTRTTSLEPGIVNRSNVYYKWVNKVAKAIGKKYPDKILGVLAYNCVKNPPSFNIEPNVNVSIACEAYALSDPEMRKKLMEFYRIWSEKASSIGIWEYAYGMPAYTLPRVYFKYAAEQVRFFAANKGRTAFIENSANIGQGPLAYLFLKLFYDPSIDVEKTLDAWYVAAVGREAAPALKKYYEFWDRFWDGAAKKSSWYQTTKKNVYFGLMTDGSYHYAVKKGDSSYCRLLMEEVVAKADKYGDAGQKKRARYLMKAFEFYEASMILNGDGLLDISGSIRSRKEALELAKALPRILQAAEKRSEIAREIVAEFPAWWGSMYQVYRKSFIKKYGTSQLPSAVFALLPYLNDKDIRKEFHACLQKINITPEMREILQKLSDFSSGKLSNMIPDGSFEKDGIKNWEPAADRIADKENFRKGKQSASFRLRTLYGAQRVTSSIPGKAGNYLFAVYVKIPADYPPYGVKASCSMVPRRENGNSMTYYMPPQFDVVPGKWTLLYTFSHVPEGAVTTSLMITFKGMKDGDRVWVDEAVFLPMGKLPVKKQIAPPVEKAAPIHASSPFAKWSFVNFRQNSRKGELVRGDDKGNLAFDTGKEAFKFFLPEGIPAKKGDKIKITFRGRGNKPLSYGGWEYEGTSWKNTNVLRKIAYMKKEEEIFTAVFTVAKENTGCVRLFLAPEKGGEFFISSYKVEKIK